MNKIIIFTIVSVFNCFDFFSQTKRLSIEDGLYAVDTEFVSNVVFDYFRHEYDSVVYFVGSVFLMPSDSVSFQNSNSYRIEVTNPKNGFLCIFFKNKLLYKYSLINYEVNGIGICFYPFCGNVALQGQFSKGKLNGLVFVEKKNGKLIEVMKYKNGSYARHMYHWLSLSKKSLTKRSKNRSANPLKGGEKITLYHSTASTVSGSLPAQLLPTKVPTPLPPLPHVPITIGTIVW